MIFSKKAMYIVIYDYNNVKIPDLLLGCSYDYEENIIELYCRTRKRSLYVEEIVKSTSSEFEFIDSDGVRVHFHPVSLKDFIRYRDYLFNGVSYLKVLFSRLELNKSLRSGGEFIYEGGYTHS